MLTIKLKLKEETVDGKPLCKIDFDGGKPEDVEKKGTQLEKTYAQLIANLLFDAFGKKEEQNKEENK